MKDEIKEILDRLDYNEWEVDLYKVPITWCELYDIRDYITNLQQRIEYLERSNNRREDTIMGLRDEIVEYEDYKSRCEKAKSFISLITNNKMFGIRSDNGEIDSLLNILNGDE